MALPRITDITPQTIHEIQIILDAVESVLAPGGGSGLGDPGDPDGVLLRVGLGVTDTVPHAAGWLHNDGAGVFVFSAPNASDVGLGNVTNNAQLKIASNLSDLANAATARGNLGVAIGSNVQAWDADLDAIAALAGTSGLLQKTGANTWALDTSTYATQAYANALVVGLLDDRGNYDASGNVFPSSGGSGAAGAILKGDLWTISVAGTLDGHPVTVGDVVRALADTPGQTDANWAIGENNFGYVALNQALADGKIYIGNGSGIGTAVTPSGDLAMSNAGAFTIAAQNSAFWRGKVTDETGSGLWVFNNNPTLIAPILGEATGTSLVLSEELLVQGNLTIEGGVESNLYPLLSDTFDLGAPDRLWRKGWLSELDAVLFAQNTISVIGGWLIVTKDEGTVEEDVDTSETQIDFGANNIVANDFIVFRSAGAVEYMQATSLASGNVWNVTRNVDGSGTNAWPQGSVWVNFGYNGTGRIELNANATPRISMFTQGTSYNSQTELLRLGDLNGWGPYVAEAYGFATGIYGVASKTWETIEQTNGIRLGVNATTLFKVDTSGNVTMGEVATNSGNTFWNNSNQRLEFRGSTAGTVVQAYVDTTGAIAFGAGSGTLDVNGLTIRQGSGGVNQVSWVNGSGQQTGYIRSLNAGAEQTAILAQSTAAANDSGGLIVVQATNTADNSVALQVLSEDSGAANKGYVYITATSGFDFRGLSVGSAVSAAAGTMLELTTGDAVTAAFTDVQILRHNSSGTPAANFGGSLLFKLESTTTENRDAARIGALWTTATDASRTSAVVIQTVNNAGALAEVARFNASGLTLPNMTAGSVLFAGTSGLVSQDNTNLFWDDTNNRLGVGTATPASLLHIKGTIPTFTFEYTGETAKGRLTSVIAGGWLAQTLNASFDGNWNLDDTGLPGWIAKLDSRVAADVYEIAHLTAGSNPRTYTSLFSFYGSGVFQLPPVTTTQRDAVTAANGMMIYNTTTGKFQGRAAGAWVDFH